MPDTCGEAITLQPSGEYHLIGHAFENHSDLVGCHGEANRLRDVQASTSITLPMMNHHRVPVRIGNNHHETNGRLIGREDDRTTAGLELFGGFLEIIDFE